MLSAFSFGKIIKTFLPDTLLCAALLVVFEGLFRWIARCSILPIIANKDLIVATTAALLPLSLLLGFVLNTLAWLFFNRLVARPLVRRALNKSAMYKALRNALIERTAFAVLLLVAALIFYLWVKPLQPPHEFWACAVVIVVSIMGATMLAIASIMNLLEFDRKFLVLVAASLGYEAQRSLAAANLW